MANKREIKIKPDSLIIPDGFRFCNVIGSHEGKGESPILPITEFRDDHKTGSKRNQCIKCYNKLQKERLSKNKVKKDINEDEPKTTLIINNSTKGVPKEEKIHKKIDNDLDDIMSNIVPVNDDSDDLDDYVDMRIELETMNIKINKIDESIDKINESIDKINKSIKTLAAHINSQNEKINKKIN